MRETTKTKRVFSARVKQLLGEQERTMSWLTNKLGVSKQTLSDWLNPSKPNEPRASEVTAIANALGTNPDYLLGWFDDIDVSAVQKRVREITGLSAGALENLRRLAAVDHFPVYMPEKLLGREGAGVYKVRVAPAYVGSPRWAVNVLLEDADFVMLAHAFMTSVRDPWGGRLQDVEAFGVLHLLDERLAGIRRANLAKVERALAEDRQREAFDGAVSAMAVKIEGDPLAQIAEAEGFPSVETWLQWRDEQLAKREADDGKAR